MTSETCERDGGMAKDARGRIARPRRAAVRLTVGAVLALFLIAFTAADPVYAASRGGGGGAGAGVRGGGGHYGRGYGHYSGRGSYHGHPGYYGHRSHYGFYFGGAYYWPWYAYSYYYAPYGYEDSAPRNYAVPGNPQSYAWYYCAPLNAYYPYVTQCPGAWQPVQPYPAPGSGGVAQGVPARSGELAEVAAGEESEPADQRHPHD